MGDSLATVMEEHHDRALVNIKIFVSDELNKYYVKGKITVYTEDWEYEKTKFYYFLLR